METIHQQTANAEQTIFHGLTMKKKLNVLIIEDYESDAELSVRYLRKAEYDISFERVETAEELTSALKKQSWDIVFSDYQLPHLNAPTALEIFQSFNLRIPFILISGAIGEEAAVGLIKSGAHNYVMKSKLEKLPSVVRHELAEALDKLQQDKLIDTEATKNFLKSNLQYLLEKKSIKKAQLSRDLCISKQTISDWLKKDSTINIHHAIKLSKYFKVTVEELYSSNLKMTREHNAQVAYEGIQKLQIPVHIVGFDGVFNFANQSFGELLGFEVYDMNSRIFSDLIHPEDLARIRLIKKRSLESKIVSSQVDVRYISLKGFRWITHYFLSSPVDKKLFIFSSPTNDLKNEEFLIEQVYLEKIIAKELAMLPLITNLIKKVEFVNELNSKTVIKIDKNILKCLMRSMIYQFQFIDFEFNQKNEVVLKSREEGNSVLLSASINCAINPRILDLCRVKKVASLVKAEVFDSYAGNMYSLFMRFPKS